MVGPISSWRDAQDPLERLTHCFVAPEPTEFGYYGWRSLGALKDVSGSVDPHSFDPPCRRCPCLDSELAREVSDAHSSVVGHRGNGMFGPWIFNDHVDDKAN